MDPHSEIPWCSSPLPAGFGPGQLWRLGEALQSLREQDRHPSPPVPSPTTCAPSGRTALPSLVGEPVRPLDGAGHGGGDGEALEDYRARAPGAVESHPDDHLRPLFVALGPPAPTGPGSCTTAGTRQPLHGAYRFG